MGCSSTRTQKVIILTQESKQRDSLTFENLTIKEQNFPTKKILDSSHAFCNNEASQLAEINSKCESLSMDMDKEFCKEGEDSEAKVIFKGKDRSKSIESSKAKRALSRKLPPLTRKTVVHKNFNMSELVKPKPNMSLIYDLLSKEQGSDFDNIFLENNESDNHDETILSILSELREIKIN